ncbi:MAG: hypothetical protein KDD41_04230 [Flavobacteriales bacterium]|nr:hypothetical protein [Flavobacteriales bacterium]
MKYLILTTTLLSYTFLTAQRDAAEKRVNVLKERMEATKKIAKERPLTEKERKTYIKDSTKVDMYIEMYNLNEPVATTNEGTILFWDGSKRKVISGATTHTEVYHTTSFSYFDESGKSKTEHLKTVDVKAIIAPNEIRYTVGISKKTGLYLKYGFKEIEFKDYREGAHVIAYTKDYILILTSVMTLEHGAFMEYYVFDRKLGLQFIEGKNPIANSKSFSNKSYVTGNTKGNKELLILVDTYFKEYPDFVKGVNANIAAGFPGNHKFYNRNLDNSEDLYKSLTKTLE